MSSTFTCIHCHKSCKKNSRLKLSQKYCNSKPCQQARKNQWEREKLKNDAVYKAKRQAAKRKWYLQYPGDQYQSAYRDKHPDCCAANREKQRKRNQKRVLVFGDQKIVKTDALRSESADIQGVYMLFPYKKRDAEKIVKTDAFLVQIIAPAGQGGRFLSRTGAEKRGL